MEQKALQKEKVNFFQKIRKYLYIKNMTNSKADKYEKLPDYLKLDEEVICAVVNQKSSLINCVPNAIAIKLIKTNLELFNEIYPIDKQIEIFSLFSDDEKIQYISLWKNAKNIKKNVIMTLAREKKEQYFRDIVEMFPNDILFLQEYTRELSQEVKEENFDIIVRKIATIDLLKEIMKKGISQEKIEKNFIEILNRGIMDYEEVKDLLQYVSKNTFDKYKTQITDLLKQIEEKEPIHESEIEALKIFCKEYRELLGEDKIQVLLVYPDKISRITNLSNKKLEIFSRCIKNHMQNANTEEWTQIQEDILYNLAAGKYDEFIEDIDVVDENNIEFISALLQKSENIYNIKSQTDMEHYSEIKRKYCDRWIKSEKIEERRLAVLEKVFGQDIGFTKYILQIYGREIDKLPNSDIKYYVQSLKLILNEEDPELLEQIYNECREIEFVNEEFVQRKLKNEYLKMYKQNLFSVKNAEQIEDNVYDAGTDFRMIVRVEEKKENYNNYSKTGKRQYFSTSYITNDMISLFGSEIPTVCFGYSELSEDSLMLSSCRNMQSNRNSKLYTRSMYTEFLTPETQVRNTQHHNEMCFRTIQNGESKKPDYIVAFRINGQIFNIDEAKKAQADFENIPIVVVDVNACLQAEEEKVNIIIEEYKNNPSRELATKIAWAIKKNRKTYAKMCEWICSATEDKGKVARDIYIAIENNAEEIPFGVEEEFYSSLRASNFLADFDLFDIDQYTYIEEAQTDKEVEEYKNPLSKFEMTRNKIKEIVDSSSR